MLLNVCVNERIAFRGKCDLRLEEKLVFAVLGFDV